MPSTATTNVSISTILDLIGSTQSSLGGDDGQSAFDAVLNSPPAPQPPVSQPPEQPKRTDDSRPSAAARRDDNSRPTESGNNNTSDDSPEPNQSKSTSAAAQTVTPAAHHDEQQPEEQIEKTDDIQQLIAQSLAGISAAAPKTATPEATTVAEETAKTTDELGATDGKSKAAKAAVNTSQKATSQAQANDAQAVLPASEIAAASAEEQSAKSSVEKTTAASKEFNAAETAKSKSDAKLTTEEPKESADKPTVALESAVEPSLDNDKSSQSPDQKSSDDDKPQTPILDPTAATTTTPDTASVANPNTATPIVAPVAATTTPNNQSTTTDAANQNQTSAVTASGPRSRLPAEALAPATGTNNRRPAVEIDSTRLLTRVVRAFSAAQERDGEVHLRLAPPELGSLRLDIRVENGNLTAHMQTETEAARTAIIDNLPALRERLAEQGVRIERFDVDLMQRQPGGMPDQQNGRQPESPEPTPRFVQTARTSSTAAATPSLVSSVSGSASGLNVIV